MAKKFSELQAKMSPEMLAHSKEMARQQMAEMLLVELRKLSGMTQEELAKILGVKQPTLSKLEAQDDMHVSTLKRIVEALGGSLEIIVHMPTGDVRLTQFIDAA